MAIGQVVDQQQQQQLLQHVVAVPWPAQGHLNPLMRFCQLLAKLPAFIITFVDFGPIHARLQQVQHHDHHHPHRLHELTPEAGDETPVIRRACIPLDGLDFSHNFKFSLRSFYGALPSMAPHLEQLILSLNRQGPAVTCLLSDFNMTLPTQDVADKLGIPRIVLYPCCASRLLFTHYLSQEDDDSISIQAVMEARATAPSRRGEVFSHGLPGLPTLFFEDIPHFQHIMDETQYFLGITKESWKICNARAHGVVVNSFMDLEKPTFQALSVASNVPIYDVGFWVEPLISKDNATSLWKEDTSCMSWLDEQPTASVLYISFGSIAVLSRSQLEEFEDGLISSGQRFLWVFRTGLVHDIDHASYVAHTMSRSNGKGFVINWAPQFKVLSHPSVGGFLTHCGWNSTSESIVNGVPMLCWPYFADQPLNARCIQDEWKVGLGFKASMKEGIAFIERDEVERVIVALMEGEEGRVIRQNASSLKEKSYECFLESGSSTMNLKALVKSLVNDNSSTLHED